MLAAANSSMYYKIDSVLLFPDIGFNTYLGKKNPRLTDQPKCHNRIVLGLGHFSKKEGGNMYPPLGDI